MSKKILAAVVLSVLTPLAMAEQPITSNSNGEYTEYPLDVRRVQTNHLQTAQGASTNIGVQDADRANTTRGPVQAHTNVPATWHHNASENGEWTTYPASGY
jgi:hypothetical protein